MSIAQIKKVKIITHAFNAENLVYQVQKMGLVQVADVKKLIPEEEKKYYVEHEKADHSQIQKELEEVDFILELAKKYDDKNGFIRTLIKEKTLLAEEELTRIALSFDYKPVYEKMADSEQKLKQIQALGQKLYSQIEELTPWMKLEIPFEELRPTQKTNINLGTISAENFKNIEEEFKKNNVAFYVQIVEEKPQAAYTILVTLKSDADKVAGILHDNNFNYIFFPELEGTSQEVIKDIQQQLEDLKKKEEGLYGEISFLLKDKMKFEILRDYLWNIYTRRQCEDSLLRTKKTYILQGWIRKSDIPKLKGKITKLFKEVEIIIQDPALGESVPVLLENKKPFEPFEAVTDLYGRPVYGGIDPTPFMAPFFAFFFGICLTDAGYGIVIALLSALLLKKLPLGSSGKRFLKVFIYCSLATIVAGALTGGWFGDIIDRLEFLSFLRKPKNSLIIFDPIKDPLVFLLAALGLGFLQVWAGVFIKFIRDIRHRLWESAIFSQLPALSIQTSMLFLILSYAKIIPGNIFVPISYITLAVSALFIIYFQWRTNQGIGLKLFWSVFGIYGVVTGNCLADILSYSRLFALGLTTGLLALAINEICFLAAKISYVGLVLAAAIFIIGHAFNIAINILGAYVHTSRLQYLEFFTKFFEGGGVPFKPLEIETKYTLIAKD